MFGMQQLWNLAHSHYAVSTAEAGITATEVEVAKFWKYNDILDSYCF